MNPILTEALVAPRIEELRRSVRNARPARTARPAPRPCDEKPA